MGFFKKIAEFLGLSKNDLHESKDEVDDESDDQSRLHQHFKDTGLPRKGFSVTKQVVVDRSHLGPVLAPSTSRDGGVQGLRWYAKRLRIDEDGDVADEFIDEVPSAAISAQPLDHHRTMARFDTTKPVKVKGQILSDGKLQHRVEHQGRLQWV